MKMVLLIVCSPNCGMCAGGNSNNGPGNTFPMYSKEYSLASPVNFSVHLGKEVLQLILTDKCKQNQAEYIQKLLPNNGSAEEC